ncbi:MAG: hypothetical protein Q9218_002703 [Villophora microphyllina]
MRGMTFSTACPIVLWFLLLNGKVSGEQHVVLPVNGLGPQMSLQTNNFILRTVGPNGLGAYRRSRDVVEFWLLLDSNSSQRSDISQYPYVKDVLPNVVQTSDCDSMFKSEARDNVTDEAARSEEALDLPRITPTPRPSPPRSVILQSNAPQDLDLVSWSVVKPPPWKMKGYAYDVNFGQDTYIYVIDNGLNTGSTDFRNVEFHYGFNAVTEERDDSKDGHGSCVASKAAGWKNGVSKNSRLVMMKSSGTVADDLWAFAATRDDVLTKRRQGKAVVVYPRLSNALYTPGAPQLANWDAIYRIIQELFNANVTVVTCAGNQATRSSAVDRVPAVWATKDYPLIVAGAVTNKGDIARFSQGGGTPKDIAWAPGENVVCAKGTLSPSTSPERFATGTSMSAGMVTINNPMLSTGS